MNVPAVRIVDDKARPPEDDRFARFRLIGWWNQDRLRNAKILVVGAGALGNEILKNLALLGVGNILIADLDRVENSNLSRSVLYRERDNGSAKAEAAARGVRDLHPGTRAEAFVGNVTYDLGIGVYRWADLVIGGLDNREARLAINRACWKVGRPWIDGAIERIQGVAKVFVPDGPCYECTMSQIDWELLQRRRSCNLLSRGEMEADKTPTTPTIASIIAGIQCQEAVKLLHGLPVIRGKGWVFDGESTEAYQVEYVQKADCLSHDPLDAVVELPCSVTDMTVREALAEAQRRLGGNAELELNRDVLEKFVCPSCGIAETLFASLGKVAADRAFCPRCPQVRREVVTFFKVRGDEAFLDRTLAEIGVPPFDILVARDADRSIGLELSADASNVLGILERGTEDLEWT